jgi:hypothetical protein
MINDISRDLGTTVRRADHDHDLPAGHGRADDPRRQADRTLPRKRCFTVGLIVYGCGAVLSAVR